MEITFSSSEKPSLIDANFIVENFAFRTSLKNNGAKCMFAFQLATGLIARETLDLAASYHKRVFEFMRKTLFPEDFDAPDGVPLTERPVSDIASDDLNAIICFSVIGLADKILEDEPLLFYDQLLKYKKIGYFNYSHPSLIPSLEDYNHLEREIVVALDFKF